MGEDDFVPAKSVASDEGFTPAKSEAEKKILLHNHNCLRQMVPPYQLLPHRI